MVMHSYASKRRPILFKCSIDGIPISRSNTFMDLGTLLDNKIAFRCYYYSIILESSRMFEFVSRSTRAFKKK